MKIFSRKKNFSLPLVAFFQASGLVIYCSLVGLLFWRGNKWFGAPHTFLGPSFFLVLFVVSALISALLVLGYPIILLSPGPTIVGLRSDYFYSRSFVAFMNRGYDRRV